MRAKIKWKCKRKLAHNLKAHIRKTHKEKEEKMESSTDNDVLINVKQKIRITQPHSQKSLKTKMWNHIKGRPKWTQAWALNFRRTTPACKNCGWKSKVNNPHPNRTSSLNTRRGQFFGTSTKIRNIYTIGTEHTLPLL